MKIDPQQAIEASNFMILFFYSDRDSVVLNVPIGVLGKVAKKVNARHPVCSLGSIERKYLTRTLRVWTSFHSFSFSFSVSVSISFYFSF